MRARLVRPALLLIALVLVLALASGCRGGDPVVVCFGDSTTSWRGETLNWTQLLEQRLRVAYPNLKLVNAGISSDTTDGGRDRLWRGVRRYRPDVVTILFGINDALVDVAGGATQPRVPVERFRENLRAFVEALQGDGARVVMLTPNPLRWEPWLFELLAGPPYEPGNDASLNAQLDRHAQVVRDVAAEFSVPLIDLRRAFEAQPGGARSLLRDGMHPNDAGHRRIAESVEPVILALLRNQTR